MKVTEIRLFYYRWFITDQIRPTPCSYSLMADDTAKQRSHPKIY